MTTNVNSSKMSPRAIAKAMRMAKHISEENDICYSRKIGTVITDDNGVILATGTNGPARKTPHTDSKEFIEGFLLPALTTEEADTLYDFAINKLKLTTLKYLRKKNEILSPKDIISFSLQGCKTCPRKLLGYTNGERSELCGCIHSEQNAIANAPGSVKDGNLFCWSNVFSCVNCTGLIINAGIKEAHFLEGQLYQKGAEWLYEKAKIPVFRYSLEFINEN